MSIRTDTRDSAQPSTLKLHLLHSLQTWLWIAQKANWMLYGKNTRWTTLNFLPNGLIGPSFRADFFFIGNLCGSQQLDSLSSNSSSSSAMKYLFLAPDGCGEWTSMSFSYGHPYKDASSECGALCALPRLSCYGLTKSKFNICSSNHAVALNKKMSC